MRRFSSPIHAVLLRLPIFLFQGVVFSEGELFLDDCDFTGSNSPILVFSAPNSTVVIRNAALGDNNCEPHWVERTSSRWGRCGMLLTFSRLCNVNGAETGAWSLMPLLRSMWLS